MYASGKTRIDWEQVLTRKPALRQHIQFIAQVYRGQRWYVLHDSIGGKQMRINAAAYDFIGRLDGSRTTAEAISQTASDTESGIDPDEAMTLLQQLSVLGGLSDGVPVSSEALESIHLNADKAKKRGRWLNPLAIRFALFNPNEWLDKYSPKILPLLGWSGLWVWSVLVLFGLAVVAGNGPELANHFSRMMSSPGYLFLVWALYPLMKIVHELSHAFFLKKWGGAVPEFGITLLLFTPVPYVDASDSWLFTSKIQRMLVSLAGILAELAVAAIAIVLWVLTEPGLVHDIAFIVFLTGTVSTILFNANPLLKFDGYYVLADLLEIPNLYSRSQKYHLYLLKRYVWRVADSPSPVTQDGERIWLFVYGVGAFIYRNIIMLFIALWLLNKFLFAGVVVTAWVVIQQYLFPLLRCLKYLALSADFDGRRTLTVGATVATLVLALLVLAWVPVPHKTRTEGVVWVPEQAQLFAGTAGIVAETLVQPGDVVEAGDVIVRMVSPELDTLVRTTGARLKAMESQVIAERVVQDRKPQVTIHEVAAVKAELAEHQRIQANLTVRAKTAGIFVTNSRLRLEGQYLAHGDLIGHIVDPAKLVVRVVVPEHRIGFVQSGIVSSQVRLAENFDAVIPAELTHETPSADNVLPSAALGTLGGGGIAIAAEDTEGLKTVDRVFHLELSLPADLKVSGVGERAYVNLEHEATPLLNLWLRKTRQLFLRQLPDYAA